MSEFEEKRKRTSRKHCHWPRTLNSSRRISLCTRLAAIPLRALGTSPPAIEAFPDQWTIELMFPLIALRQLEPLLATSAPEELKHRDPLWQARLARQMGDIRLSGKTVLARPTLTLEELLNLRNGDVIPVNIARHVPLIVGNRVLAHGTIGEQNGRSAFMIENLNQG